MQRLLALLLCAFLLACADENYLQLPLNSGLTAYLPAGNSQFVSNLEDTLLLTKKSDETFYERQDLNLGGGALGQTDYVELEQRRVIYGSDTPFLEIEYLLNSRYNANTTDQTDDFLSVSFREEATGLILDFAFNDTLQCRSERCSWQDSLTLRNRTFTRVYFTPRDSMSRQSLYLNQRQGILGFRTLENKIYETID